MNKKALITTIESSLAIAISKRLISEGFDVVATHGNGYKNDNKELEKVRFYKVSLHKKNSLYSFIEEIKDTQFDVIINCAAELAFHKDGRLRHEFFSFDFDSFQSVFNSNIISTATLCIELKDSIKEGGSIINVTSSAADEGGFATISYNASKAAMKSLTKSLANNFGPYNGVRVNSISPGWIPPKSNVVEGGIVDLANSLTPNRTNGTPEDVADAAMHIINQPFINGASYELDGGITSSYLMYMIESLGLKKGNVDDETKSLTNIIKNIKDNLAK